MNKAMINKRALDAINYIINNNNVSKTELSNMLGIKISKFSEILNERMNVGVDIMAFICLNYGISAEWLLTGEGEMLKGKSEQVEPVSAASPASTAELRQIIDVFSAQLSEKDSQIASLLALLAKHS